MLCEICKKNTATIHIQEVISNKKKSLHICPACAAEKNEDNTFLNGINLAEMLYNLSEQFDVPFPDENTISEDEDHIKPPSVNLTCSVCQWDTDNFRKTGRLGCAECYSVFKEILDNSLKNMHRGTLHVGKQVGKSGGIRLDNTGKIMLEVMTLQKKLDELVQREEYEEAAVVRDKINALKKKT